MKCPVCASEASLLLNWPYRGLNDSIFNFEAHFAGCSECGLCWINNISDDELARFYSEECAYFSNDHFDVDSPANIKKFEFYRSVLREHGINDGFLVDIGCGRGGFLKWMQKCGWNAPLSGVDVDLKSLPDSNVMSECRFMEGNVFSLPLFSSSQYVLTYFHVLEHVINSRLLLNEAFRVLKDDGYLLIEVPDASRYQDHSVSPAFWLSIREHVNHFSPRSMCWLLEHNGFEIIDVKQPDLSVPEFNYSSLIVLARKTAEKAKSLLSNFPKGEIAEFVVQSYAQLKKRADEIISLSKKYKKVVFWGISNQLLAMLPHIEDQLFSFVLCDTGPAKRAMKYKAHVIHAPEDCFEADILLVICSHLHHETILKHAKILGWSDVDCVGLFSE